ncbi:MAG TPA: type II toxin-antitoxin system mRNA interferase toxin, RelE/StbE family [Cyanobacteria bacterium UBA11372]|nr:type II toxin-antitoxin system mRNA interferase toxin, RelE/StbE family [Cyanobacteria bacterium UBA11372]
MTYTVIIPKIVQKQIDSLPEDIYERVIEKLQQLAEDPCPSGVVKLKGTDNEYRIRIGDYRVLYEINDEELIILLLQCKHRRDAYRKR